jgi:phage tail tape-measure protein
MSTREERERRGRDTKRERARRERERERQRDRERERAYRNDGLDVKALRGGGVIAERQQAACRVGLVRRLHDLQRERKERR